MVTNKSSDVGGLHVYDLAGSQLFKVAHGSRIVGVDVRDGFPLGGDTVPLVAVTNTTSNTVDFFKIDPATRAFTKVGAVRPSVSGLSGVCMYQSPVTAKFYAFATTSSNGTGVAQQLELSGSTGAVATKVVRTFTVGTQIEACAADDGLAHFYVSEKNVGLLWKYGAEPSAGTTRVLVDNTEAQGGHLVADVEGIEIWYGPSGNGWLLVSSQGESTFAVYSREGTNTYRGEFDVTASGAIDDTEVTDGIDVTSASLPPPFEGGLFVAHDHSGAPASNVKYVKWSDIAAGLGL
jgi:3-phytase